VGHSGNLYCPQPGQEISHTALNDEVHDEEGEKECPGNKVTESFNGEVDLNKA
jgi:hypothetical protein